MLKSALITLVAFLSVCDLSVAQWTSMYPPGCVESLEEVRILVATLNGDMLHQKHQLQAQDREIAELKATLQANMRGKDQEVAELKSTMRGKDQELAELRTTISEVQVNLRAQNQDIDELKTTISEVDVREQTQVVAFTATMTSGQHSFSQDDTVTFTHTISNFGGNYDPATSSFTCPVTGVYVFHVSVTSNDGQQMEVSITSSSSGALVNAFADDNDDQGDFSRHNSAASALAITRCGGGDTVSVICVNSGTASGSSSYPRTSFSGFLLHKL